MNVKLISMLITLIVLNACATTTTSEQSQLQSQMTQVKAMSDTLTTNQASTKASSDKLTPLVATTTQKLLNSQCHSYIEKQSIWQGIKMTMSSTKAQQYIDKVCSCASESAAKNMTAQALALADKSSRNQVLLDLTSTAVQDCIKTF